MPENTCDTTLAGIALHQAADHLMTDAPLQTRDWSEFFKALAAFMAQLLPIVIPLILSQPPVVNETK